MKKLVSLFVCFIMVFSAVTAGAANVPNFMKQDYNNYTADCQLSLSFESGRELAELLDIVGANEEISKHIDIKALSESLLSSDEKVNIELKMSEDYKRADIAVTMDHSQNIIANKNLGMTVSTKSGMWLHMNLDKEEFEVIYSTPFTNKYAVLDAADFPEDKRAEVFKALGAVFSKELIDPIKEEVLALTLKYAQVSMKGSRCIVKYDNDAFIATIDDMVNYAYSKLSQFGKQMFDEELPDMDIPSLKGVNILGDKGITITYYLKGTKISRAEMDADICVSVPDIYTKITGDIWPYETKGEFKFKLSEKADYTKLNTTNPRMPEITAENSFSILDKVLLYDEYEYYGEEYYEDMPYVYGYASCWDVKEICENGVYFVPLRELIEDAYYNCSEIIYKKGNVIITLSAPDSQEVKLTFYTGDNKVFVTEGSDYTTYTLNGTHRLIDQKVYVSSDFFEKCMGWTLEYMSKDMLAGTLSYEYDTGIWD